MTQTPQRLMRAGRDPDPHFEQGEHLYFRFVLCNFKNNEFQQGALDMPVQSVNREKYSEPEDLLIQPKHRDAGVGAFRVRDIPAAKTHSSTGSTRYSLQVVHVPEEDNYAHSEVQGFVDGELDEKKRMHREIRKAFRTEIFLHTTVIKAPTM